MKSFLFVIASVFTLSFATATVADEIGPGKPGTETQTQSITTATECGMIESLLGLCETTSTTDTSTASE